MEKMAWKFCLAIMLVISATSSYSQYICTDIVPDSVVVLNPPETQHTINIDLNNDNVFDFHFVSYQNGIQGYIFVKTAIQTATNFAQTDGTGNLLALNSGTPIGASSTVWSKLYNYNPSMSLLTGTVASGMWVGKDRYAGVALAVASNTYFGWIRVAVSGSSNSFTVKEYAFNSVPGASIVAGACSPTNATGSFEQEQLDNGFELFPNPTGGELNIRSLNGGKKNLEIVVMDVLGRVQFQHKTDLAYQNSTCQLNLNALSRGIYFVHLKEENGNSKVTRIIRE